MGDSPAPGAALKDLSDLQYSRLSELLDESIDMAPAARDAWLDALERSEPELVAVLRALFATPAAGFLEGRELLTRHLAALGDPDPGLVGKTLGPYRVVSLLGHGGMGSVWLGERVDGLFTRQVALKLIHTARTSRAMTERLTREREILAGLDHPNIARLLDAGFTDDGQPYLALEYVAGRSLSSYCDSRRLPLRERLQLFRQVLSAVQFAHSHLVIHRDLKPSNIMVTEEGQVRLLDFGIAKLLTDGTAKETQLTQLGGRSFTPDYAAPEQIVGAPITTAADVYALGVILYELLTGERPYRLRRASRGALEDAILQADAVAPSRAAITDTAAEARATTAPRLAKAIRGDLDAIAMTALKKSPGERYATGNAFDEDIARHLRGEAVLAQRDRVAYRAVKFARRHWLGLAVVGGLVLTLAGGLAATGYEARVASEERDAALQAEQRLQTQTAAARLKDLDVPGGMNLILDVLRRRGVTRPYTSDAIGVFQAARAADSQILAITGHTDRLHAVAFSPDGRYIVTASYDKTARIWDAATGQPVRQLSGHTDWVMSAAFSPDGRQVVTASSDLTARIWDVASGREVLLLGGHTDAVISAAFSPDGRRVVTASADKTARVWDAATGLEIRRLSGHADSVRTASFSADGRRIVTASFDRTARIWDAATGRQILSLGGHTDAVTSAAFSPDGRRVVTASADKTARIWDTTAGQELRLLSGHTDLVFCASFSADGLRVVTGALDRTARIWDASSGRALALLGGHTDGVVSVAFSPDGRSVATASQDGTARTWDTVNRRETRVLDQHSHWVISAAFSPDGTKVVTASADKTARVWDAATGQPLALLTGHTGAVTWAAFSPDGRSIVTASLDKTARIWDIASGSERTRLVGHTEPVNSAAFALDGRRIVTGAYDKTARIWDAATGRELLRLSGHENLVASAAFSPDGRRVVTASYDKTSRVWDAATGRQLLVLAGHSDAVNSSVYSPDGRLIVTASADKTARIWNASSGREIKVLSGHTDIVETAGFSPDGGRIATAANDATARIWDAASGRELLLLSGHGGAYVESAAFSPDGERVITASYDKTARIWDVRVPSLDAQLAWAEAAQFESLSATERLELGLSPPNDVRQWPAERSACDDSAAAPYDPDRRAPGVTPDHIVTAIALTACAAGSISGARSVYQLGRARMAIGDLPAARRQFEDALADGHRSAGVDLARLLSRSSTTALDIPRALRLYQRAWNDGVTIAAFELGQLYEHGVGHGGDGTASESVLIADMTQAWSWYQKAAASGQPDALARLAEAADDSAFSATDIFTKHAKLREAFRYYAAAAERARLEDWPESASRNWRYRRASLARLLANSGMMQDVADAYLGVRDSYAARPSTWQRLLSASRME